MFCAIKNCWNKLRLRSRNIQNTGFVVLSQASSAIWEKRGRFVMGAAIHDKLSLRFVETVLVLGDSARLITEDVTLARGARVKVGSNAQMEIGKNSYIGENNFVAISTSLKIGSNCHISWDVHILDDDGHEILNAPSKAPIVIGNNVWIGARATILKGAEIGDGSIVAAGAVVTGKFPAKSLIGGVPAKVIRENVEWK